MTSLARIMPRKTLAVLVLLALSGLPVLAGDTKSDPDQIGNRKVAHRSIISQEKEIAIGRQYASEIERSAKLITDPVITEYVNRIAQNVARNSDLKVPLTVKVIDAPEINAFALPGGFLFVYSGLLKAATEEDQVAGVVAHEIGHVAARHWASALNFGVPLAFLKFSRNDEAEADYLGLQYMYKAGYDPNSYVAFFGKIMEEERRQPGSVPKIFQDHPPTPERIVKAEEEIKQLPKRDQYLVTTSEFNDVKAHLNTVIAQLKRNRPETGPTLERREPQASASPGAQGQDQGDEKPPVLRRRD